MSECTGVKLDSNKHLTLTNNDRYTFSTAPSGNPNTCVLTRKGNTVKDDCTIELATACSNITIKQAVPKPPPSSPPSLVTTPPASTSTAPDPMHDQTIAPFTSFPSPLPTDATTSAAMPLPSSASGGNSSSSSLPWTAIIAGSAAGGVLLLVGLILLIVCMRRRRRQSKVQEKHGDGLLDGHHHSRGSEVDLDPYDEKPPMHISSPTGLTRAGGATAAAAAAAWAQAGGDDDERYWKRNNSNRAIAEAASARNSAQTSTAALSRYGSNTRSGRGSRTVGANHHSDSGTTPLTVDTSERPMKNNTGNRHLNGSPSSISGSTVVSNPHSDEQQRYQHYHQQRQRQLSSSRGSSPSRSVAPSLLSSASPAAPRTESRLSDNSNGDSYPTPPQFPRKPQPVATSVAYTPKSTYVPGNVSRASNSTSVSSGSATTTTPASLLTSGLTPAEAAALAAAAAAAAAASSSTTTTTTTTSNTVEGPISPPPRRRAPKVRKNPPAMAETVSEVNPISAPLQPSMMARSEPVYEPEPEPEPVNPSQTPMERPESEYLGGYIDLIPIYETPILPNATLPNGSSEGSNGYSQGQGYHDDRDRQQFKLNAEAEQEYTRLNLGRKPTTATQGGDNDNKSEINYL
ncbi:hypothetical protein BX616_000728 [Lobosporangium transversale]|uniref:Uncharacterized protein n=1 Tax=Lobosporangium transversale TaxID=64571 RepID=A0A1Y2GZM2_9FUNG|nr:hypothetical protein BCR41DRAFT_345826 [Lobosporangium transversale]KAF9917517.1 hypothetical protein BX616_000728 [Lobosporangium transversale]ORZ27749.1 hypothetical protein BCR41DRAFT_345826 [Lobosporangium transversale]|eukprot:XP_021885452.1 hypothetical protein BCR41DRAFT_345826 [Lobosporangium transversale]